MTCNWCAAVLSGTDWRADFQDVIFQMWFVVGLAIGVVATVLLKAQLRPRLQLPISAQPFIASAESDAGENIEGYGDTAEKPSEDRLSQAFYSYSDVHRVQQPSTGAVRFTAIQADTNSVISTQRNAPMARSFVCMCFVVFAGQVALAQGMQTGGHWLVNLGTALFGSGGAFWGDGLEDKTFVAFLTSFFNIILIAHAGSRLLRTPATGAWLSWALLVYIYLGGIVLALVFGHCKLERAFFGLELFVVSLVASRMGLKGAGSIRRWLRRYWFFFLLALAFLWDPRWDRRLERMDESPPADLPTLVRVKASEALCVVGFLSAGELLFDAKWFAQAHNAWLMEYGLVLFLAHKAVHILAPSPLNWLILVGLAGVCWLRHRRS